MSKSSSMGGEAFEQLFFLPLRRKQKEWALRKIDMSKLNINVRFSFALLSAKPSPWTA